LTNKIKNQRGGLMKNKKKAYESKDAFRLSDSAKEIPLITDTTEYITPEIAEKMLQNNNSNRPIGWGKVEQYKKMMIEGKWEFHSQGIILDNKNNILTGQKRLWAIVLSGIPQYFRISKGTPSNKAHLIDRGTPQSARDLASRKSERKHSPTEGSIVRAMFAIEKKTRPSVDEMALKMAEFSDTLKRAIDQLRHTKKTKSIIMVVGAICWLSKTDEKYLELLIMAGEIAVKLDEMLYPMDGGECWNKGIAFAMAMNKAVELCKKTISK